MRRDAQGFSCFLSSLNDLDRKDIPPLHTQNQHRTQLQRSHYTMEGGLQLRDEAVRDRIQAAQAFLDPREPALPPLFE